MSDELKRALDVASSYIASSIRSSTSGTSKDIDARLLRRRLYDHVPTSHTQEDSPARRELYSVICYCLSLLQSIHHAVAKETSSDTLGAKDIQTIEALLEVVFNVGLAPFVTPGLGPVRPRTKSSALGAISDGKICSISDLDKWACSLMSILKENSVVASRLRTRYLPELFAVAVELAFNPVWPSHSLTRYHELTLGLQPRAILSTCILFLHKSCPPWARMPITKSMTDILLHTDGVRHVCEFILQPDAAGNIAMERFDHLGTLITSRPSAMSETEYVADIFPQVISLLRDQTQRSTIYRKASLFILKRLITAYPDAIDAEVKRLTRPIRAFGGQFDQDALIQTLSVISELTQDAQIVDTVLPGVIVHVSILALDADYSHQTNIKDLCERLLYRYIAQRDAELGLQLISGALMSSSNKVVVENSKASSPLTFARAEWTVEVRYHYLCRIIDQVKDIPDLMNDFFYLLLARICHLDLASAHWDLQILSELPLKYATIMVNSKPLAWHLSAIGNVLQSAIKFRTETRPERTLVVLNLLKVFLDNKPVLSPSDSTSAKSLHGILTAFVAEYASSDAGRTANNLQQELDLCLLQQEHPIARPGVSSTIALHSDAQTGSNSIEAHERYAAALKDMADDVIPTRAHGLFLLSQIAESHDSNIIDLPRISPIILHLLSDEEAFVHQHAIKAMVKLIRVYGDRYKNLLMRALHDERETKETRERIHVVLDRAKEEQP